MSRLHPSPRRRFTWTIAVIAVLLVATAIGWVRVAFTGSMTLMLPENSDAERTLLFLQESRFASRAVLWIQLRDGESEDSLFTAARDITDRLDMSLVRRVIRPPQQAEAMQLIDVLLRHQGELIDPTGLEQRIRPEALAERAKALYVEMLKPSGSMMQSLYRADPLGLSNDLLARLYGLTRATGYRAEVRNGQFVHSDGRQLFILLETAASITNVYDARRLAAHLNDLAATAPAAVVVTPLAGHFHTVDNERIIQTDLQRLAVIDLIGFSVVFLAVYRDWRVAMIFVLPMIAITIAIGICGLAFGTLAAMVVGLAATMAGCAVDYGIHVYTSVRLGRDAFADARHIARPLLTGMMATAAIFVAFMFSGVPAYRQLGAMASTSLLLSALGALYVLPAFVKQGRRILGGRWSPLSDWAVRVRPAAVGLGILGVIAAVAAVRVRFDPSLNSLDGVTQEVVAAEARFEKAWTRDGHGMAMVVARGRTPAEAAKLNDQVQHLFATHLPSANLVSLASVWPSEPERAARQRTWQAFWTESRIAELRDRLRVAAKPYGFAESAFDPFFAVLQNPPSPSEADGPLAMMQDQFLTRAGDDTAFLSYLDDDVDLVARARDLVRQLPDVQIVSGKALGQAMMESSITESRRIVLVSLVLNGLVMAVMIRSLSRSVVILLPAMLAVVAMLGVSAVAGLPLNAATLIAAIVAFGLCIDYGVFAADAWDHHETTLGHRMTSVHLSSITTLVGSAALLLAQHPAMFRVGVVLNTGLVAGYIASVFVVPTVCSLTRRRPALEIAAQP